MGLKRWIAALTAAAIAVTSGAFSVVLGSTSIAAEDGEAPKGNGEAPKGNYEEINDLDELKDFRERANDGNDFKGITVMLTDDITLVEEWEPIEGFAGTFDGGGHTISGLTFRNPSGESVTNLGFFGTIKAGGTVKNLGIVNSTVNVSGSDSAALNIGGIAGQNNGTIKRCYNAADISLQGDGKVGGIAGESTGAIENCYNTGSITVSECQNAQAGGIAGSAEKITNSYNTGAIEASPDDDGENTYAGGIVGKAEAAALEGCYYLDTTAETVIGSDEGATENSIDSEALKEEETFDGWDFADTWEITDNGPVLKADKAPHVHDGWVFLPWEETESLTTSGHWYLTKDVTLIGWYAEDPKELDVCLNGQTILVGNEVTAEHQFAVINNNATVSIYDCSPDKGTITENPAFEGSCEYRGGVVENKGTLNIYGGNIVSERFLGIYNNTGIVNVYGGKISGIPYGMFNDVYNVENRIINLSGNPVITGEKADIYLSLYTYIGVIGELTNEKPYRIEMTTPGVFTSSKNTELNDPEKFESAMEGYIVVKNPEGQLEFVKENITVTFDYQGADSGNEKPDTTVKYGEAYGELPEPEKTDHKFAGWFTEADGGERIKNDTTVTNGADHTLYAHWTKNTEPDEPEPETEVTVTFNYQGADGGDTTPSKTVKVGEEYGVLPEPTRTGYTFGGWYTAAEGGDRIYSGTTVTIDHDHDLYAYWTENAEPGPAPEGYVTVTFDYQYPDGIGRTETTRTVKIGGKYGEMPVPAKVADYKFVGWYTEAKNGTLVESDTDVISEEAHTLYAHWEDCDHSERTLDGEKKPTCTENGKEADTYCAECGRLLLAGQGLPAIGHDWRDDWRLTVTPTLTAEGRAERICKNDPSHIDSKAVPVLTDESVWELKDGGWEPSCTVEGRRIYYSAEYNTTVDLTIPKLEHKWDNGRIIIQPTATRDGSITYTCALCGSTRTERIPATGTPSATSPSVTTPAATTTTPAATTAPTEAATTTTTAAATTQPPASTTTTAPVTQPSTTTTPPADNGSSAAIALSADSGANAPAVSISSASAAQLKSEVIANHLTAEEKAAMEKGAALEIIISVEDAGKTVSAAEKSSVETAAAASSYTVGQYLNIDILKYIDGQQTGKISQLNTPISITVGVPDSLRNSRRSFAILRVHDGEAKLLKDTDSDPNTITISTDKFSTYAIVYQDTADVQVPSNGSGAHDNPNTGVRPVTELAVLSFAFGATAVTLIVTGLRKKKKS